MEMRLYTIFDEAAEECGPIFSAVNDKVALRQYRELVKSVVDRDDYSLFFLGRYETSTMEGSLEKTPMQVMTDFKAEVIE